MSAASPLAFDDLLGPLVGRGYALAVTMLNDPATAEDAVQEAAIKAWRKLSSLRDRSALEPWFLSIVANECRSIRRGRWWSVLKFPELRQNSAAQDPEAGSHGWVNWSGLPTLLAEIGDAFSSTLDALVA